MDTEAFLHIKQHFPVRYGVDETNEENYGGRFVNDKPEQLVLEHWSVCGASLSCETHRNHLSRLYSYHK